MQEESALSIFRKLPETKSQVKHYASLVSKAVQEGEVDPLMFAVQVKALEEVVKTLRGNELTKDAVLEAAELHGAKTFDFHNSKIKIMETGVKYDYSQCDDLELIELQDAADEANAKLKARQEFLKAISPEAEIFGKDGVQIHAPVKSSTTTVSITLNS